MLTKVRIVNFKAFRDQTLPLAPLTLLTGLNGSGKSSLMQALLLLRQSGDAGLLSPHGRLALDGSLVRLGTFKDALYEEAEDEAMSFHLAGLVNGEPTFHDWGFRFDSLDERVSQKLAFAAFGLPEFSLFGPGFRFISAERIGPRVSYALADSDLADVGLGTQGEWTAQYLAAHRDRHIAIPACAHSQAASLSLANQVEAWMSEFSPGLRIHLEPDQSRDSVGVRYSFVARRNVSNQYRPTNVGFGISYTLPVVVAVLAASPGDLLMIEAPEAHLHPRGQSQVGQLLALAAQGGVQCLVETHSDHVMNGVRVALHQGQIHPANARFLYFRFDADGPDQATTVEVIEPDDHGRIARWPEGFFDELDKSLEILLAPKGEQE